MNAVSQSLTYCEYCQDYHRKENREDEKRREELCKYWHELSIADMFKEIDD